MGECFFWYRPTWVVLDKRPLKSVCVCVCVCVRVHVRERVRVRVRTRVEPSNSLEAKMVDDK